MGWILADTSHPALAAKPGSHCIVFPAVILLLAPFSKVKESLSPPAN